MAKKRWDHRVQWSDKEIRGRHGIYHVSSMWRGVGVYMSVEIVPERFRKGHVFWEPVSWKGSVVSGAWLQAIPYLCFPRNEALYSSRCHEFPGGVVGS